MASVTRDDSLSCTSDSRVVNVLIIASHVSDCVARSRGGQSVDSCTVDRDDARLYRRYDQELWSQPSTSLWMLLYRENYDTLSRVRLDALGMTCPKPCTEDRIVLWGEGAVWRRFPSLAASLRTHPHLAKEDKYLRNYYWFHAVLPLWLAQYGSRCFPQHKYVWRMETDVLWTSTIDQLISLVRHDSEPTRPISPN